MLEVRLMGSLEEVEEANARLAELYEIKHVSPTLKNRRAPGVRRHLHVVPQSRPVASRWVCRDCGSLDLVLLE